MADDERAVLAQGIARKPRAAHDTSRFVEVRDPRTLRLVCRYNPQTREVVTIGRSGDERRGTLPS